MLIFQSSDLNLLMLSLLQPSVGEIDLMAIEFDQIRLDSVEKCAVPTMNRPHIHAIRNIAKGTTDPGVNCFEISFNSVSRQCIARFYLHL